MYIKGKYLKYGDDLSDVKRIRRIVFQEEQGIAKEVEQDEYDNEAIYAIAYKIESEDIAVATGRLILVDGAYKIGRIAVLKEERGKQYGDFVVKMLINKAFTIGAMEVNVSSQEKAIPFYKKIGFIQCGDPYEEIGLQHYPMKITPKDVCRKCSEKTI